MTQLVSGRAGTLTRQAGTHIHAGNHSIMHQSGVDQSGDSYSKPGKWEWFRGDEEGRNPSDAGVLSRWLGM